MGDVLRSLLFLPTAATEWARAIDRLHFFVITVTFLGAGSVGIVALFFLVRYRRRGAVSSTPRILASRKLELFVGGSLLSTFLLWWGIGFYQYVHVKTPPSSAFEVYVTAKQWMWNFSRPDGQRSAAVLVVPEDQAIRLLLTSRDVVHSFYVPSFRIKQDALPGRYTTIWFKPDLVGTYPVYCAEYCGIDHSRMWASIVVLTAEDYQRWLDGKMPPAVEHAGGQPALLSGVIGAGGITKMADRGREAASHYACFSCHTVDGQPHIGPTFQGLYLSAVALESGETVRADEAYLTQSMMDPASQVVKGFRPVMPTFLGTLKQADTAAIVEFIKSLRFERGTPAVSLPKVEAAPRSNPKLSVIGPGVSEPTPKL